MVLVVKNKVFRKNGNSLIWPTHRVNHFSDILLLSLFTFFFEIFFFPFYNAHNRTVVSSRKGKYFIFIHYSHLAYGDLSSRNLMSAIIIKSGHVRAHFG